MSQPTQSTVPVPYKTWEIGDNRYNLYRDPSNSLLWNRESEGLSAVTNVSLYEEEQRNELITRFAPVIRENLGDSYSGDAFIPILYVDVVNIATSASQSEYKPSPCKAALFGRENFDRSIHGRWAIYNPEENKVVRTSNRICEASAQFIRRDFNRLCNDARFATDRNVQTVKSMDNFCALILGESSSESSGIALRHFSRFNKHRNPHPLSSPLITVIAKNEPINCSDPTISSCNLSEYFPDSSHAMICVEEVKQDLPSVQYFDAGVQVNVQNNEEFVLVPRILHQHPRRKIVAVGPTWSVSSEKVQRLERLMEEEVNKRYAYASLKGATEDVSYLSKLYTGFDTYFSVLTAAKALTPAGIAKLGIVGAAKGLLSITPWSLKAMIATKVLYSGGNFVYGMVYPNTQEEHNCVTWVDRLLREKLNIYSAKNYLSGISQGTPYLFVNSLHQTIPNPENNLTSQNNQDAPAGGGARSG